MSSIYIHIPFCASKCPYCDFFSQVGSQLQIDEYVKHLILNIEILSRKKLPISPLGTIFFGGGTPSLLSPKQIETILDHLERTYGFAGDLEITLEGNPGTLDGQSLSGYREAGINRLSLGIQSLNEQNLQFLGRIHSVTQARESVAAARSAGFENLSLDLMFALPEQNISALGEEIIALLELAPEHISLYGLSFEEGTNFYTRLQGGTITPCDENLYADQYQLLDEKLKIAGYEHYEISNFALAERRCRHNQVYWQREDCLAIGAGAHSFINHGWGERWHIPANLQNYSESLLQGNDPAELLETYDQAGAMREFVYLALRTSDGIDPEEFKQRFNLHFQQVFSAELDQIEKYLISPSTTDRYRFNINGWLLYDHLISHFL